MKARRLEDRAAFCGAIDRVAPQVLAAWNELAAKAPTREEIVTFLSRCGLDVPGLEWLADGLYQDARSPTGDPRPHPPSSALPLAADGVLDHGMLLGTVVGETPVEEIVHSSGITLRSVPSPIVRPFSWEPAETGEHRERFRRRVVDALDSYIARVEAWMREHSIEMPPREHDRGEVEMGAPRWDLLASKLVLGWSDERIGAELGITKQAASKHIKALATRLGVTLRVRQPRVAR